MSWANCCVVDQEFLCFNWSHCIAVMYCLVFCIGLFVPEHLLALELS